MTHLARAAALSLLIGSTPLATAIAQAPVMVVFFPDWSGALDQAARDVVKDAAKRAKHAAHAHIVVAAYADSDAGAEADQALTKLRARRVADLLERDGIPAAEITIQAEGAARVHGVASRRAEITVSGQ